MVALFVIGSLLVYATLAVYVERKVAAFIQDRIGPIETGPWGLLQPIADVVKLLRKQPTRSAGAIKGLFWAAPILAFASVCGALAWLPILPTSASNEMGLWLALLLLLLEAVALFVAGWSSYSKYALLGAFRLLALVLSYEVLLGVLLLNVALHYGTLDLSEIAQKQQSAWGLWQSPGFFLTGLLWLGYSFFAAHRAPLDLPETESELVAGYFTEYSGIAFGFFMLAEYAIMAVQGFWIAWVFLGAKGWWLWTGLFILLQMVIRWSWPRWRPDQGIRLAWLYGLPSAFVAFLMEALWQVLL